MSTPHRFFVENLNYPNQTSAYLQGEEFSHAKTVLRVAVGDEIILLDNSGKEYSAIVDKIEKQRLSAHITGAIVGDKEPKKQIYLICGLLKNADKNEFIVQKAIELGVGRIAFFSSEFCSAYINPNKLSRLNRVAREAVKQCLRSRAPEVEFYDSLEKALKSAEGYSTKFFACEFLESSQQDFGNITFPVALMVGSEGGFSFEEFALAQTYGFKGISLGRRILRAETAAISVCALAAYFGEELK